MLSTSTTSSSIQVAVSSTIGNSGKSYTELLPPEVLTMIFHEVLTPHERNSTVLLPTVPARAPVENKVETTPLHTLSHVCRYWRQVALGTSAFWIRIHGRCQDQMEAFLARSQPMTVSISLGVDHWGGEPEGSPPPRMVSAITAYGQRLRRLDLSIIPIRDHVVPLLASLQAPHLQALTIVSPYMFTSFGTDRVTRESLLNGDASSLKALAIMPVIDWIPSRTPFPNLTHLLVFFNRMQWLSHPFDVLELLSNTPTLAFLHLDFLLGDAPYSGNWHPASTPISLPHLRSLVFTYSSYQLVRTVISRLALPEDVFIRIQDMYVFGLEFPTPLPLLPLRPVASLDLSLHPDQVHMVADGPQSGLWLEGHLRDGEPPAPAGNCEAWLTVLRDCLAHTLAHITHLHVYIDPTHTFWHDFLAHLPHISDLTVLLGAPDPSSDDPLALRSPTTILCDALSPHPEPIRCPMLSKLTVEWQERPLTLETTMAFQGILGMLAARARAGHPIRRFVGQASLNSPVSDTTGLVLVGDLFREWAASFVLDDTEYEIVGRPEEEEDKDASSDSGGLGAFVMRDVWKVAGTDEYWEVDNNVKPRYRLSPWL